MGIDAMRTYKRKTHCSDTPDVVMLGAVNQVVIDGTSIYRVTLNLDLSRHMLTRYVKMWLEGQAIFELKTKFSHRLVFNKNEENELADYLKIYSVMFYGLSIKATKKLAYELAMRKENKMPPSCRKKGEAGEIGSLVSRRGMKRLVSESLRLRAISFKRVSSGRFFVYLGALLVKHEFGPAQSTI